MGRAYHLWNPFTDLEEFLPYKDVGPMTIVRGEGPFVYNEAGEKFINASGSLWNVAVGHGREELADIAFDQMKSVAFAGKGTAPGTGWKRKPFFGKTLCRC